MLLRSKVNHSFLVLSISVDTRTFQKDERSTCFFIGFLSLYRRRLTSMPSGLSLKETGVIFSSSRRIAERLVVSVVMV